MSAARSGCGIMPKTLRSLLQTPAIFFIEPLGFESSVISPFSLQYLKRIWSLVSNSAIVFASAKYRPSPYGFQINIFTNKFMICIV